MTRLSIGQWAVMAVTLAYLIGVYVMSSDVWMGFTINALVVVILAISWNITGGFGGLLSFGHAAMYGTGAYASAIMQVQLGVNAWIALAAGILAGAVMGAFIGAVSFRYGLKGSYFALVTLAFAEVLRVCASSFAFTGGGSGLQVPLNPGISSLQFTERATSYIIILVIVLLLIGVTYRVKNSRFGAYLIAIRENEDAARALGINTFKVKTQAMALSGAIAGLAGVIYLQLWLYIDASIVYGITVSTDALIGPLIGGAGSVFGALVGTLGLHLIGESAKHLLNNAPGLNFVLYAVILMIAVRFLPQGIWGGAAKIMPFNRKDSNDA